MKLVIGIIGLPLAGKETIADTLEVLHKKDGHTVSRHGFSDILRETLTLWGMPHGRDNEQILAQLMTAPGNFKEGALSQAVKNRISTEATDVGILDGMRWLSDEAMLREFPAAGIKSIVIYVTASADRRYERLAKRNRSGEAAITRGKFDEQGKAQNESYVPEIGARADVKLQNEYEKIEDFQKDIEAAYRSAVKPLL